jgi:hypothetical protein
MCTIYEKLLQVAVIFQTEYNVAKHNTQNYQKIVGVMVKFMWLLAVWHECVIII